MKSYSYKILPTKYSFRNLRLNVYTYRQNLALNNLQRLIRHKTETTNNHEMYTVSYKLFYIFKQWVHIVFEEYDTY